jgi:hypothetical protein
VPGGRKTGSARRQVGDAQETATTPGERAEVDDLTTTLQYMSNQCIFRTRLPPQTFGIADDHVQPFRDDLPAIFLPLLD